MDKRKFKAAIRKHVKESGKTRVAIAEEAGLSESHIRACENGTIPSVENAHKLLRVLGLKALIGDPNGREYDS